MQIRSHGSEREDLVKVIKMAFTIARTGKPEVVLADIPKAIHTVNGLKRSQDGWPFSIFLLFINHFLCHGNQLVQFHIVEVKQQVYHVIFNPLYAAEYLAFFLLASIADIKLSFFLQL